MGKGRLLDEARKRTGMNRKYLIRKLRPLSNLDKIKPRHRRRKELIILGNKYSNYSEAVKNFVKVI